MLCCIYIPDLYKPVVKAVYIKDSGLIWGILKDKLTWCNDRIDEVFFFKSESRLG